MSAGHKLSYVAGQSVKKPRILNKIACLRPDAHHTVRCSHLDAGKCNKQMHATLCATRPMPYSLLMHATVFGKQIIVLSRFSLVFVEPVDAAMNDPTQKQPHALADFTS